MKLSIKILALILGIVFGIGILAFAVISYDTSRGDIGTPQGEIAIVSTAMEKADSILISKIDFTKNNKNITPVDLGLPSGTKWADRNVGAKSPSDYGNLYRYGNPKTKIDGSNNNHADESNIIGTSKDVATAIWGSRWNTPSIEQMEELLRYCKSALITVKGKKVVAIIGPNDKYILLPLVGSMFNYGRCEAEEWGLYEAGNLKQGYAFQLVVTDDGRVDKVEAELPGYYGCAIRAVEVER